MNTYERLAAATNALPTRPVDSATDAALFIKANARQIDSSGSFPVQEFQRLKSAGLLNLFARDASGRCLLDTERAGELAEVLAIVGAANLSVGRLYEGHVNALTLIRAYGKPDQVTRWAADAAAGLLFGVWNTDEPGKAVACSYKPGQVVVSGRKHFASGCGFVQRAIVTAGFNGGRLMLVVPLEEGERADLSPWQAQGMRASASGAVDLDNLTLDESCVLGEVDDYIREPLFSGGAWRFTAVQVGGIQRIVDEIISHHKMTGRGNDAYQSGRLGEALMSAETARMWVMRAAAFQQHPDCEQVIAYTNLTRSAVLQAGVDVLALAERSIGLQAFLEVHPLEQIIRDLQVYLRQPAPDRALASPARWALTADRAVGQMWRDEQ